MPGTQRVSPASSRTDRSPIRRPDQSPSVYAGPLQLSLDETHDLRPRGTSPPEAPEPRRNAELRASAPPLTQTERTLRGVLRIGLAVTAAVLATRGTALTLADILLGSTVLVAGLTLLVVMELCRR